MAKKIKVEIVTPNSTTLSGEYNMVVVRTLDGEIGILPNHTPLIGTLLEWPVKLKLDGEKDTYVSVSGGFMEVRDNKITILATTAEMPENIDISRANKAKERAEQRLAEANKYDQARANAALKRATGRIKTVEFSS